MKDTFLIFLFYTFIFNIHFYEKDEINKIIKDLNNQSRKPNKKGLIIGILNLDTSDMNKNFPKDSYNMIPASYVKWIEQMGARVMPINYTDDFNSIKSTLNNINGILFTGGSAYLFEK